jgi:uncharacterized membrane protein YedE/YeeE
VKKNMVSFLVGLTFGVGLIASGMTNPAKVIGFLDLFGNWDPSLALVMGGAIAVGIIFFRLAGKRDTAILGGPMKLPTRKDIDKRLVIGSVLFGAGWALGGFCPGPDIVSVGAGKWEGVVFVLAMLTGMLALDTLDKRRSKVGANAAVSS